MDTKKLQFFDNPRVEPKYCIPLLGLDRTYAKWEVVVMNIS